MTRWLLGVAYVSIALSPLTLVGCGPIPFPDDTLDAGPAADDASIIDDATTNDGSSVEGDRGAQYFCMYHGQIFHPGDTFPAGDNCNGCSCSNGQAMCTACACFDGGTPGEDGGSSYKCGAW